VVRVGKFTSQNPSRPLFTVLPQLCLALLVLAAGFLFTLAWLPVAVIACFLVLVGLVRSARAAAELGRRRRAADEWLLWGAVARPSSALLSWRVEELASPRLRSTLARGLRGIEREVRGGTLPGPVPLNARAIRRHLGLVRALQRRLEDCDPLVSVRGILLVERLLTEPGSPLYSRAPDEVLAETLSEALAALDYAPLAAAA